MNDKKKKYKIVRLFLGQDCLFDCRYCFEKYSTYDKIKKLSSEIFPLDFWRNEY